MKDTRRISLLVLSFFVTAGVLFGCHSGGSSTGFLPPSADSLKVTVVNETNRRAMAGVTVVLGDSTGAMITSAVTDGNGAVTFSNPPANATVTAAYKEIYSFMSVTTTNYNVSSVYDVNVSSIVLGLSKKRGDKIGTANVNIICAETGTGVLVLPSYPVTVSCPTSTAVTPDVYDTDLQSDGKISFVAAQASGLVIDHYAILTDQTFVSGMTVTLNMDQTEITPYTVEIMSLPTDTTLQGMMSSFASRNLGAGIPDGAALQPAAVYTSGTMSWARAAVPNFATEYTDDFTLMYPDFSKVYGYRQVVGSRPTTTTTIDFALASLPALATNVSITAVDTARPVVSWQGSDSTTDVLVSVGTYPPIGNINYLFRMNVSPGRTSVTIPELPASLAEFIIPAGSAELVTVDNYDRIGISTRNDFLSTMNAQSQIGRIEYYSSSPGFFFPPPAPGP